MQFATTCFFNPGNTFLFFEQYYLFARRGGNDDCFIEGDCFVVPPRNDDTVA